MKPADFNALVAATKLDPNGGTVKALRLHLVGGKGVAEAASASAVERQAVYVALKKLPRERCPCCAQWLPPNVRIGAVALRKLRERIAKQP